ncbi:hypothetical protein AB2L30_12580 [Staphylococcus pseudintermedius]|uniref:hypothetical protein n=1 Tax=Staphylococcus pseudintermedius TaxID=283734 RepID=UPI002B484025|nr:hypothetical protein [Staphylococcus pseudintermedius]
MKGKIFSKIILSTTLLSGVVMSPYLDNSEVQASEQKDKYGELHKINESEANIVLEKGYTYKVKSNGTATLTKTATGETKELPTSAKDKNGKDVIISYEDTDKGLKLMVIDASKATQTRGWKGALKCGLGTAGGAGTVALGGFGVGGPGGAVVGAIAGGMSGAAASCF